jgi:hypothetical protein
VAAVVEVEHVAVRINECCFLGDGHLLLCSVKRCDLFKASQLTFGSLFG